MRSDLDHYSIILGLAEKKAERVIFYQCRDCNSINTGGIFSPEIGLYNPGEAVKGLLILLSLYVNNDSIYYLNIGFADAIELLFAYMERVQRQDGTFDLLTTNFYSAPDTGFCMHSLVNTYRVMDKYREIIDSSWQKRLLSIIEKAGYGICRGGFHTPNHRWVNTAALLMAYKLLNIDLFKEIADRYLAEGIDCDNNGEYTERSAGIYNATNDDSLIKIAEETENWHLLDFVRRNIDMLFYYIEPDDSIFTQNSVRQDKGDVRKFYPTPYYSIYLYMAWKTNNGRYLKMADNIMRNLDIWEKDPTASPTADSLYQFILNPSLKELSKQKEESISSNYLPSNYHKYFEKSGIVRCRRGGYSFTILENNSSFLYFQTGKLTLSLKLTASFFASAVFKAKKIDKVDGSYLLDFTAFGSYKMPFDIPPDTTNWWEMNHNKREIVNRLELRFSIFIKEIEEGISIQFKSEGCNRVPVKLEFVTTAGSFVEGEGFLLRSKSGQSVIARDGFVKIRNDMDHIIFGPSFAEHYYTSQMRGSEKQSDKDFTIYFTDFSNIDREISIRTKNG